MSVVTPKIIEFKLDLSVVQAKQFDLWFNLADFLWNRGLALLNWHEYYQLREECQFLPKEKKDDENQLIPEKILKDWGFVDFEKIWLAPIRKHKNIFKVKTGKSKKEVETSLWLLASDCTSVKKISINDYPGYNNYIKEEIDDKTTIYSEIPGIEGFIEQKETSKGIKHYLHTREIKLVKPHWAKKPPFEFTGKDPFYSLSKIFSKTILLNDPHVPEELKSTIEEIHGKFIYGIVKSLSLAWVEYKSGKRGKPKFKKRLSQSISSLKDSNAAKRATRTDEEKEKIKLEKEAWNVRNKELKKQGEPTLGKYKEPKNVVISSTWKVNGDYLTIPKTGTFKVKGLRKRWGNRYVLNGSILKKAGCYYVQLTGEFEVDLKGVNLKRHDGELQAVGIDAGVVSLFITDSGIKILPRTNQLKDSLPERVKKRIRKQIREGKRLSRLQRKLSRCKLHSKNWSKTHQAIQKIHEKQSRRSRASDHKITTKLLRQYDGIACENLNLKGMTKASKTQVTEDGKTYKKNRKAQKSGLNRNILRNTPGRRVEMLMAKAKSINEESGKTVREVVKVNPKNTSIQCRICGTINKKNRPQQDLFKCVNCGHTEHADDHAARNILLRAKTLSEQQEKTFARSYRPWGWEVKPVSDRDVLSGEIGFSQSTRQEAAGVPAETPDTTAPQAEICHTILANQSQNRNLELSRREIASATREVFENCNFQKQPETLAIREIEGGLSESLLGANSEMLANKEIEPISPASKKSSKRLKRKKQSPPAQSEPEIQLELDLWGTALEIESED